MIFKVHFNPLTSYDSTVLLIKNPSLFTDIKLSNIPKHLEYFIFFHLFSFTSLFCAEAGKHRLKLRKMILFYFQHDRTGCVRTLGTLSFLRVHS